MVGARVFVVFSLGFLISYLFRGVNLTLAPELAAELALTPADLGLLTSLYFVTFAGFQIPLGMLLDRFGPRRVDAALLCVAAAGALVFAFAQSREALMLGRLLIGVGVSACLMAALKAMIIWFPKDRLPSLNGGVFAIGGLGAVAAATPIELALAVTDWRGIFVGLAVLTLAVAVLILAAVPERRTEQPDLGLAAQLRGVRQVVGSGLFWRVAPLTMLTQGVFMAIQGLWAGPYLQVVEGFDRLAAANAVALIGFGMVAGYWLSGVGARWLGRRGITLRATAGAGMLLFVVVQALILLGLPLPPAATWVVYGFFGGTGVVSYAVLNVAFPAHLAGRVSTALTLTMFASAFLFQVGIGLALGWMETAGIDGANAHRSVWLAMLLLQAAAFVWYCVPAPGADRVDLPLAAAERSGRP
ncbi:MAG TPA: MFS transporter [Arenibaculum sp.]|nr:MFS transporter [Arenibaculum sp.]